MDFPDPCGNDYGYQRIAAVYIMFLYLGMNYKNIENIWTATVSGYAVAINTLFTLCGFKPPIESLNPNNLGASSSIESGRRVSQLNASHFLTRSMLVCLLRLPP